MSRERFQRLLERRWVILPLSVAIALVSGFLVWGTLQMAYSEYWLEPKLKAADPGLYIYPQLRYTIFDSVFLLWCLDGLMAAGLSSLRSSVSSRSIAAWAYRTIVIYLVLLAVLILGGSLMLFVRSRGY